MIALRPSPRLPAFANGRELKFATATRLFGAANGFLRRIEWLIHPRMRWIGRPVGRCTLGWLTLLMSGLMILPIPLTNTFPAMVIFAIGVGLSEEDGLLALAAFGVGLLAVAFYGWVAYLLATTGVEGVLRLKDWIKTALGLG